MKYPAQQFEKLVDGLKTLKQYFDVDNVNHSQLNFIIYQQYASEGQEHNAIYVLPDGKLIKKHSLLEEQKETAQRLFAPDNLFLLYPEGCNDNHIETAVRNALKLIQ
jgi:hypothetical protein